MSDPTQPQQGDVCLFQTIDDGEILVIDGVTTMTPGLDTTAYLCLFGGNEDDDGSVNNPLSYWANLDETDNELHYRSEVQHLLRSLPATANNLIRIERAALRDLSLFITKNIASSVEVVASIPRLNWLQLDIMIDAFGERSEFTFTENWEASS